MEQENKTQVKAVPDGKATSDGKAASGVRSVGSDIDWGVSLALLWSFVGRHRGLVAMTVLTVLLDMTGMLFVPTELAALINAAVNSGDPAVVGKSAAAMFVASIVGSGGAVTSSWFAARLSANVGRDIRVAVYEASLSFSGADFEQFGTGSMITRTLSDINVIQQTLLMSILMIFPVPILCVISVCLAWSVDHVMGLVLLAIAIIVGAVSLVAVGRTAPVFTRLQGFIDRMNVRMRESITGVRPIRAFGREAADKDRLDRTFSEYADNAIKVNYVFSVTDSLTFFVMNMAEVVVVWLGADRVGAHAMQIGSISALVEYAMLILFFMMMMQFAILSVPRAMACLARANEVLTHVPSVRDPESPVELDHRSAERSALLDDPSEVFRFDHASLRFPDADECTLFDLDFPLRRGEVVAIIGNTGSGKSTIAKMLLRLHDATEGRVLFRGVDVRDVTQADLRSHVSYVPQRAWLFSGTIADNLRHGRADATDDELWHAIDVAQAGFVRELPDGLATTVAQGGTNFSGGQRQRLAIARALVRRSDLYVFDDSFSALDYKTDAALRHALRADLADAAQLIVAQRVGTIHDADRIVVLRDGRIVGQGTHDELMGSCPTYRAIAESQAKGGANDEQ